MGNSKAKVQLAITTDKEFYLPGQCVEGFLFINSPKPYPASQVVLQVEGLETNWWRQAPSRAGDNPSSTKSLKTVGSGNRWQGPSREEEDHRAQCTIIQAGFLVMSWNKGSTLHGQYSFPFQFYLPTFVPGSFRQESADYKACIEYKIKACIEPHGNECAKVQAEAEFVIREDRKVAQEHLYNEVYLYPQTCLCFSKGVSKVCCYFEKNQYLPGQECCVICEVDNFKCSTALSRVDVRFLKSLTLVSSSGEETKFVEEVTRISFPGAPAHGSYTAENAHKLFLPLQKNTSTPIHPSTSGGRYVKCEYYISVTPQVSGCCVKGCNSFCVGLNILQPGMKNEEVVKPNNWEPEVFKKSKILLSACPENEDLTHMDRKY